MSITTPSPPVTGPPRLPSRRALAACGLLAVGAALAFGQLAAALAAPGSAPFVAVADTVIRLSPSWLTEFGKSLGPVLDKLLLQVGVGVAVVVAAAAAGAASRRSARPGLLVIGVLGAAGLLAVAFAPAFAPRDLLAPIVAALAGVSAFAWLHRLASSAAREPGPVPAPARRRLLIGGSVGIGIASLAAGAGGIVLAGGGVGASRRSVDDQLARTRPAQRAPAIPAGAAFPESGTPSFLTSNADFYRIDVALRVPSLAAADWRLRVHGLVQRELTLSYADLLARPLVERTITMTCVSNPVGGDLVSTANFLGVELRDLLLQAGVRPGADQLFSTSVDGWSTGTPTDVVLEPDRGALLAIGMNGEALPPEHGFPVRMVVPGLYGYVSATKWITDIELTTFDAQQGYWLQRGWAQRAPIKTQSRIDFPRGFATVPAGRLTVAGIAWAQHTGVGAVEVRMDGGPWQRAELGTEVNRDTWRMWRTTFDVGPGSHTVQTRSADARGVVQTETRADPIPDGASGWPATIFTAA
ncbi:MAG TPA: molybdopterin-dependent oxidoreductase [Pseudonocardia sp.]|nr:molybdopterin-dependent oxidoreductase [Pseudonocardia sp.]